MTLPYPDKPDIADAIQSIIDNTKSNLDYLDTNPSAYNMKFLTRLFSAGNGTEAVTTGFQPRVVIVTANITGLGSSSIGYYGPSDYYKNFTINKTRYFVSGTFYQDRWDAGTGGAYSMYQKVNYDGSLVRVYGGVSAVSATGYTWNWVMTANALAPGVDPSVNVVCLAIK